MLKKFLVAFLCLTILLPVGGCKLFGSGKVSADTLEWFVNVSGFDDAEDTLVDRYIFEKTGVKIKFIVGGNEASSTTLAGMINSDTLPDIISWERTSTVYKEAVAVNQLYNYEELFDEYGVKNFIPAKMKKWNNIGGKSYGVISHFSVDDNPVNFASYVLIARKDLLTEYDIDPISGFTNMSAFKQSLLKAKANNIGDKAFIPFYTADGGQTLHQFLAIPKEDTDGNYIDWKATPEAEQLIKDMNDFYLNGLLTNESLAGTITEKEAITSGRVFCMLANWAEVFPLMQDSYDLGEEWVAVGPLRNNKGEAPMLTPWTQAGYLATSISKNCKNPEAALKLIEFLYSDEGQRLCTYGIEGVTYTENADGTYSYTAEYLTADGDKILKEYGTGWTGVLLYNTDYIEKKRGPSMAESRNSVDEVLAFFTKYTYDSLVFEDIHPTEGELHSYSIQAGNAFNWKALVKNGNQNNIVENYRNTLDLINKTYKYGPVDTKGTIMEYYNIKFKERKQILGVEYAWPANFKLGGK